jgi:hypothetical protein
MSSVAEKPKLYNGDIEDKATTPAKAMYCILTRLQGRHNGKKSRPGSINLWWQDIVKLPYNEPRMRIEIVGDLIKAHIENATTENPSYPNSRETARTLTIKVLRGISDDLSMRAKPEQIPDFYLVLKDRLDRYADDISRQPVRTKKGSFKPAWVFAEIVNETRLLHPEAALGYMCLPETMAVLPDEELKIKIMEMFTDLSANRLRSRQNTGSFDDEPAQNTNYHA